MSEMRRTDMSVTAPTEIVEIIKGCDVCRIGFAVGNEAYIVPLNFGFAYEFGQLTLYFHCAGTGRKLELMRKNPQVCFEMDRAHRLITGSMACQYSMEYESVMGEGRLELIQQTEGKRRGLECIMEHYEKGQQFSFDDAQLERVEVLKLTVHSLSGKRARRN